MSDKIISVFGSDMGPKEIYNVTKCLQSQWLSIGQNVQEFEEKFKEKFNLNSFAMVDNGSNALFLAITLLNLPKNSEIIVPSFTWLACAQAVIMAGHIPVFCDVDVITMNVTRELIEKKINKNTAAIMVVHYAGLPVEMNEIMELNLPIIEDAAHAVYSQYNGITCGNIADIGIFSFDSVKNLAVGEGGGVCANNAKLIDQAKSMRYCGIGQSSFAQSKTKDRWWEYDIKQPFIKMIPTDISASIGLAQLDRIEELQDRRKHIWDFYKENLKGVINPVDAKLTDRHSYFTYTIKVENRDELAKYLLSQNIYTTLRYHPLHLNEIYKQTHISLPNCEYLNNCALSIPLHPRLTISDVEKIVEKVNTFVNR
jgi:dTDP-4-amino-4,6-dideoxygalactose transaminase